jgi:hypothetical protein
VALRNGEMSERPPQRWFTICRDSCTSIFTEELEMMRDAAESPSPEADPGRYESGELTPEEKQASDPAEVDNE